MSTSSNKVYESIKNRILNGAFDAGQRLPEDMIAADLGLSRTPVRDALRRLQADGLVEIVPNSGGRVAQWTSESLGELAQLRAMLEGYAAELAATKIAESALLRLDRLCNEMQAITAASNVDLVELSRNNLSFHREIAVAANNARLLASIEPLLNFSLVERKFALFSRIRLDRSLGHHREITSALREHDRDWARSIMQNHIQAARAFDASMLARRQEE